MNVFKLGRVGAWLMAAALSVGAGQATSATLGLSVEPAPEITGSGSASNDTDPIFGFGFNLLANGATSTAPAAETGLNIVIAGIFGSSPAALNVGSGTSALFLGGVQSDLGHEFSASGPDTIEILFSGLTGSAASSFGSSALAVITGEFGDDASALFSTGFPSTPASVVINPVNTAVIPLPAGLPLLASALLAVVCFSRRRNNTFA